MKVHSMPSRAYSSCSKTNMWWLKNCCSFSLVKLMQSCSKPLNCRDMSKRGRLLKDSRFADYGFRSVVGEYPNRDRPLIRESTKSVPERLADGPKLQTLMLSRLEVLASAGVRYPTNITFSIRSIHASKSIPKSMKIQLMPSFLYSSCSSTNMWWLKNCCSFSLVKLMQSCSKPLNFYKKHNHINGRSTQLALHYYSIRTTISQQGRP